MAKLDRFMLDISLESMIKVRPCSMLWQVAFSGMTLDMLEYVGMQRRIAGKLENLLCVLTQTIFLRILSSLFDTAVLQNQQ